MEDSKETIVKSIKNFFCGTFLSRMSGMCRDMSLAYFFGNSPHLAAFLIAFRFSNFFRRLLGEGAVNAGFIPHYESIKKEEKKKAAIFYRDLFFTFIVLMGGIVLLGEVFFLLFGKRITGEGAREILFFAKVMLPGLIFICLYALNGALLQSHRKYFLFAVAPIAFNLVWICFIFFIRNKPVANAVFILSFGVIFAYFMQWMMTAFSSFSLFKGILSKKEWFSPQIFSSSLKRLARPFSLGILGIGAIQVNNVLDSIFARIIESCGPTYLWYSVRVYHLPFALFGIAIAGALLPPLSRAIEKGDKDKYFSLINLSLCRGIGLMLTATVAIFILGGMGINLLFGRGDFSEANIWKTLYCLWNYTIGLLPATGVLILAAALYAKKNYFIPTMGAILAVCLNIFLNSFFIFFMKKGVESISLATSISSFFNFLFLAYFLQRQEKNIFDKKKLFLSFSKTFLCNCFAASIVVFLGLFYLKEPALRYLFTSYTSSLPRLFSLQLMHFLPLTFIFLLALFVSAKVFKTEDILDFVTRTSLDVR